MQTSEYFVAFLHHLTISHLQLEKEDNTLETYESHLQLEKENNTLETYESHLQLEKTYIIHF